MLWQAVGTDGRGGRGPGRTAPGSQSKSTGKVTRRSESQALNQVGHTNVNSEMGQKCLLIGGPEIITQMWARNVYL